MLISCRTFSVLAMGATVFAACADTSVTGSFQNVHVADPSDVIVPIDLSQDQITVYVDGDDTPVPAQGFADGTFTTGIEADRYDLVWRRASGGSVWLLAGNTGPRNHTIVRYGRPDSERPTQDTFLNLTAQGLSPWSDGDGLEVLATNVNLRVRLDADTVTSGMTGFVNKQLNWYAAPPSFPPSWPLVDASHGDRVRLLQYSQRVTPSGHAYRSLVRDGLVDEFALISGDTTDATVTMTQSAQTNVRIRVDLAQLETMTPRVHPDAVRSITNVRVRAIPKWREFGGFYGRGMALAELHLDQSWDDDLDDELTFADSTPSDWDRIIEVASWFTVEYINPDTGEVCGGCVLEAVVLTQRLGSEAGSLAISLVVNARIDGKSAFHRLTAVSLTPTFSWSPPEIGKPTYYYVEVYELVPFGEAARSVRVVRARTRDTRLTIPAGLLKPGTSYVALIAAMREEPTIRGVAVLVTSTFSTALLQ